jgi:solute carrier family 45, member 1/2/4
MALILLAGPLSGLVIQPLVGASSDRSQCRWGKRRPYVLSGAVAASLSLAILAWSKSLVGSAFEVFHSSATPSTSAKWTIAMSTANVYIFNISMQPVMWGIRALVVDTCSADQQLAVNACLSRFSGLGSVAGFLTAGMIARLPELFLDYNTLKISSLLAATTLCTTSWISCLAIREDSGRSHPRCLRMSDEKPMQELSGFVEARSSPTKVFFQQIASLTHRERHILIVQAFSWMAWFPFLYYNSE